jgi:hypothetical protein
MGVDRRRPALLPAVVALVGVVLLIVWGGAAVAVEDAFWFLPVFSSDAARIELYWDGGHVRLLPGSAEYALLNEAVRADLPHVRAYPEKVGLSDGMLERLRVRGRLVEVHYAEPVRIHSRYRFGSSTVFYIPLSGPHAAQNRVFNRGRGAPLELESAERIRAAAEAVARQEGLSGP